MTSSVDNLPENQELETYLNHLIQLNPGQTGTELIQSLGMAQLSKNLLNMSAPNITSNDMVNLYAKLTKIADEEKRRESSSFIQEVLPLNDKPNNSLLLRVEESILPRLASNDPLQYVAFEEEELPETIRLEDSLFPGSIMNNPFEQITFDDSQVHRNDELAERKTEFNTGSQADSQLQGALNTQIDGLTKANSQLINGYKALFIANYTKQKKSKLSFFCCSSSKASSHEEPTLRDIVSLIESGDKTANKVATKLGLFANERSVFNVLKEELGEEKKLAFI